MVGGARMGTFVKVMLGVFGILAVAAVLILLGVWVGVTNHQIESQIHGIQPRVPEEIQRNFDGIDDGMFEYTLVILILAIMLVSTIPTPKPKKRKVLPVNMWRITKT